MMFYESHSVNIKLLNKPIGIFNDPYVNFDISNFIFQKVSQQTRWRNRF